MNAPDPDAVATGRPSGEPVPYWWPQPDALPDDQRAREPDEAQVALLRKQPPPTFLQSEEEPILPPRNEWRWIEDTKADIAAGASTPWSVGLVVSAFCGLIACLSIIVLTQGLADRPWLAIIVNLVVALGMAPALWLARDLPVLRFLAFGLAAGLVVGWIVAIGWGIAAMNSDDAVAMTHALLGAAP